MGCGLVLGELLSSVRASWCMLILYGGVVPLLECVIDVYRGCLTQVNTLHLHSNQFHLASSASDGTVAVWDVRHLGTPAAAAAGSSSKPHAAKAVCKVQHQKSSQAAYWCPDRSCKLLSISFDDTLRIWEDPAGKGHMQQAVSARQPLCMLPNGFDVSAAGDAADNLWSLLNSCQEILRMVANTD